jgi:hypothetical protein
MIGPNVHDNPTDHEVPPCEHDSNEPRPADEPGGPPNPPPGSPQPPPK